LQEGGLPPGVQILPVLPSGHPKVKDLYRFQLIIKTLRIRDLGGMLEQVLTSAKCKIDVDPISTFF